ncbi:MAG: hypothetical protein IJ861_05785 [Clostridia bacterium]|nr:hypothetical protein [Clostridia bacterium]
MNITSTNPAKPKTNPTTNAENTLKQREIPIEIILIVRMLSCLFLSVMIKDTTVKRINII